MQDGKLVATVEKKGTPWVLVVKDPAGAIVALLKNTGTARNAVNLVNFDSNTINEKHGANVTYAKFTTGSVFCSRPRREGQPTALTFEGVEMYAWADLHRRTRRLTQRAQSSRTRSGITWGATISRPTA